MSATTPNSPSKRKQIDKMNKPELMEEVRCHRQRENEHENLIKELKHDVKEIKDELNEIRSRRGSSSVRGDFETRLVQMKRGFAGQEHHTRREFVDIVGLFEIFKGEDLEEAVLKVFEVAGVPMEKRVFHVIHSLRNTTVVIAKVCNRRDAIAILPNKRKLRELRQEGKKKLKSEKIYVNESLCPAHKRILGKCNALLKKKYVDAFYTINGKVKIKYGGRNRQETTEISHEKDLIKVSDIDITKSLGEEHENNINPHN